jgi:hypothetical protein
MVDDEPPRLAAQSARDVRWALEQTLGVEVVARALASLPDDVRREYAEPAPLAWVPYDVVVRCHEAIAREAGTTMEEMLERAVPLAVERAFRTVWRVLLRFTSDAVLIARTPLLYSKTRSKGTMTAQVVSPGHAVAEITGWPSMPPRDVRALELSIATLVRLAGRKDVEVDGAATTDGARYVIRWRE